MSEKMRSGNEEVDESRRGFLGKLIGTIGAGSLINVSFDLGGDKKEAPSSDTPSRTEAPYNTAVSELSRDEAIREIVHDKAAVTRLQTFLSHGVPTAGEESPENVDIQYFLNRYKDLGHTPNREEIDAEITVLSNRITLLEARRDNVE